MFTKCYSDNFLSIEIDSIRVFSWSKIDFSLKKKIKKKLATIVGESPNENRKRKMESGREIEKEVKKKQLFCERGAQAPVQEPAYDL